MSAKKLRAELKSLGNASGAKTYRRHGATGEVWGVRYADFYKLQKRIGADQALADALWDSGVHDAGVLYDLIDRLYGKKSYEPYVGGLGRYKANAAHGPFVHVDVRGTRARWGD